MVSKSIIFKIDVIPHFTLNVCRVFNGYLSFSKDMGMTELQKSTSLGTRKNFKSIIGHMYKTQRYLYSLSQSYIYIYIYSMNEIFKVGIFYLNYLISFFYLKFEYN